MTTASISFSEGRFWEIIENSNKGKDLASQLEPLSEEELIFFHFWWDKLHNDAYLGDLWAVAHTICNGCSDDSFIDFRSWLLTRGRAVYERAIANPDSLCDEFDLLPAGERPRWEVVAYVVHDVFEKKYSKELHDAQKKYAFDYGPQKEIEMLWNGNDEASIRSRCPRTYDTWRWSEKFYS